MHWFWKISTKGFPDRSVGKEFACNAGDPSSIPGLGRSPGEGIGYPLQYSWASLVAQLVKNLPAMRETWVQYLGWEDPLEKGKTHSRILAWRIPRTTVHGVTKSRTRLSNFDFHFLSSTVSCMIDFKKIKTKDLVRQTYFHSFVYVCVCPHSHMFIRIEYYLLVWHC